MSFEYNHYYEFKNAATGKFVNLSGEHEDGIVKNGEIVNLFSHTANADQRWALENFGYGKRVVLHWQLPIKTARSLC